MLITKYSPLVACAVLVGSLVGAAHVRVIAQELRSDLSGRWRLNQELSENAQTKVDRMQSPQGHGPGRHGFGGLFGRLFGGGDMEEARGLILNAPASFTLTQGGDRIVLTGSDGRVRTLTANGRKEKVNGRDVQTRWDKQRLVSEIFVGDAKVTETYERSTNAPQLIVTTRMDMRGHDVSVRRVYDSEGADQRLDALDAATCAAIVHRWRRCAVVVRRVRAVLARHGPDGHDTGFVRLQERPDAQPLWRAAQTEARGFWTTKKVLLTVVVVKAALLFTVLRH